MDRPHKKRINLDDLFAEVSDYQDYVGDRKGNEDELFEDDLDLIQAAGSSSFHRVLEQIRLQEK